VVEPADLCNSLGGSGNVPRKTSGMTRSKQQNRPVNRSQGGLMLWHGMNISGLSRLVRSRPSMHWSRLHKLMALPPMAVYNSAMGALESMLYGRAVAETELIAPPLIVLGFWRSGTTLLQNLLSHDPQFGHLGLYQALFPWHFLLTETVTKKLTAPFVPRARPMDNMEVSWDAPQEDDIATAIMSQVSPYMFLSRPHDLPYFWKALDFEKLDAAELERYESCLMLLLKKMTYKSQKRIMLKSPFHTYHVKNLVKMFPDARFLYIHRNPLHVVRSACHLRRRMIEENTLGRPEFCNVEDEIIDTYRFGLERYEQDRHLIPEGHLHEICYEKLEVDPIAELGNAYGSLGLNGFADLEQALLPTLFSLRSYQKNQFNDDPALVRRVHEELQPAFERFGYAAPDSDSSSLSGESGAA
jgi:omega-hydroxy-beta-dihydromenaquinone-9 sulfotransferase